MAFGQFNLLQPSAGSSSSRGAPGPPGAPGPGLENYKSVSLTTANPYSGNFKTLLTLSTDFVNSGTFRLGISYNWRYSNTDRKIRIRVIQNGDDTNIVHNLTAAPSKTDNTNIATSIEYITLSSGIHTFEFQLATEEVLIFLPSVSGGIPSFPDTANVSNIDMEFWKEP